MAKDIIYGVDVTKKVTPVMIRNAIVECFIEAHKAMLDQMKEYSEFKSEKELEEMKRIEIKNLIVKIFSDVGGDFDNPDKESLIKVVFSLKEYAANFRKPDIINKHAKEITQLIDKLD